MEVKIVKKFRDKHTKRVYEPGETVTMTKTRFKEVIKNLGEGFVAEATPPEEPGESGSETTPPEGTDGD